MVSTLTSQACQRVGVAGLSFSCPTPNGKDACERFVRGGMAVDCAAVARVVIPPLKLAPKPKLPPAVVRTPPPAAAETPQAVLSGMGCQQFGPNPSDWYCLDARAFATCVAYVRANNQIAACLESDNQALFATDRRAVDFLATQGCQSDGSAPLGFACATETAVGVCQQFITGGMPIACQMAVGRPPPAVTPLRLPGIKRRG